jgi:leucine dehydrogenase
MFSHEQVSVRRGARSGLPIIIAIHSSALGPAVGGCRLWHYPDWRDGLTDALRLSEAMTLKTATANLPHGGGKTVVALPPGVVLGGPARRDVLRDVGELVESFGGRYATGPDVGTCAEDMNTISEATRQVFCRPESVGGSGDPAPYTAAGVRAAIGAVFRLLDGRGGGGEVRGRTVTLIGLGHVGTQLARMLARDGARLTLTDVDERRRALAEELDADWCAPGEALTAETDLLVPAALGGQLTAQLVPELRCRAIVGPANNQLAEHAVAELLHRRGIPWVPDYLASAGGVIFALARELRGAPPDEALRQVDAIGGVTEELLHHAARLGISPHLAALRRVGDRLAAAPDAESGPTVAVRDAIKAPMMN